MADGKAPKQKPNTNKVLPAWQTAEGFEQTFDTLKTNLKDEMVDTVCQVACAAMDLARERKREELQKVYDDKLKNLRELQINIDDLSTTEKKNALTIENKRLEGLRELQRAVQLYELETKNLIESENRENIEKRIELKDEQCRIANELEKLDSEIAYPTIECDDYVSECDEKKVNMYL